MTAIAIPTAGTEPRVHTEQHIHTEHRTLIRIGSVSAVIGAIIFMIANIVHPRSPNIEVYKAQIELVAHSHIWVTDHLFLFLGGFLLLGGLIAVRHSIATGAAAAWAQLGYVSAVVSTSLWAVLMGLDGIASKAVHSSWAVASIEEKVIALRIAEMMEEIDVALFSLYIILFFGITFFLYGVAVSMSDRYPKWLGWVAIVLALAAFVVGVIQTYAGLSVLVTNVLFATLSSFLTLWVFVMGVLTWRKAGA